MHPHQLIPRCTEQLVLYARFYEELFCHLGILVGIYPVLRTILITHLLLLQIVFSLQDAFMAEHYLGGGV